MRVTLTWPFLVLALGAGCAAVQIRERLAAARGTPIATVDQATFDGVYLDGRVLVSSSDGGYVVIDRRLSEHVLLVADGALDCDGGSPIPHVAADGPYFRPGPDDLLKLEPGDWFGRDFSLFIYDEGMVNAPPPGCLDALLSVRFGSRTFKRLFRGRALERSPPARGQCGPKGRRRW